MSAVQVYQRIGPTSTALPQDLTQGWQPPSRQGEITINAFNDAHFYEMLKSGGPKDVISKEPKVLQENLQPYNEWASVHPGAIAVMRRNRIESYRFNLQAETSVPVVTCATKLDATTSDAHFEFAGICRSKLVLPYDDGQGPTTDEMFTLTIVGMVQLMNNGEGVISQGAPVKWSFSACTDGAEWDKLYRSKAVGPRYVTVKEADHPHEQNVFGKAMSFAKRGELFDVLVMA